MKKSPDVGNQVVNSQKDLSSNFKKLSSRQNSKNLLTIKENDKQLSEKLIYSIFSSLSQTAQESSSRTRFKRNDECKTVVEATARANYFYRLNAEDIFESARLAYNDYQGITTKKTHFFAVITSIEQLETHLEIFQQKEVKSAKRLTLIVRTENQHWLTLVVNCLKGIYRVYYADSKNNLLQYKAYHWLFNALKITPFNLTPDFIQQAKDDYNGGLWALENAADINRMLDYDRPLAWGINQLKQARDNEFFIEKRLELSHKLFSDSNWLQQHPTILLGLTPEQKNLMTSTNNFPALENGEPSRKRVKISHKKGVKDLLDIFTESYINTFGKRLAAYHIIAREERLSLDALKSELKTGVTAALLGAGLSQSIVGNSMGAIPSVIASARAITGKYFGKRKAAQKITKCFDVKKGSLSTILAKAAVNIFYSYEAQFMRVTDKAGDRVAMEKLADDAVDRAINYIQKQNPEAIFLSNELLEKGVVLGSSETFFDPNLRIFQLKTKGKMLLSDDLEQFDTEIVLNTAKLYEQVGLINVDTHNQPNRLYKFKEYAEKYGFRRLFDWEKEENAEENLGESYKEIPFEHPGYNYVLVEEAKELESSRILDKMENRLPLAPQILNIPIVGMQKPNEPMLFDLPGPISGFIGRKKALKDLHDILAIDNTMAVVSALSSLRISSSTSGIASPMESLQDRASSSLSARSASVSTDSRPSSISGLGGIGKTQLALQYCKEYARYYDNHILWINAETLENLDYSFSKLAKKLQLETKDHYGQDKELEEIVDEVYNYFSDTKSLFVFDNVENYNEIKKYLPKSMLGNKPSVLITSRYSTWDNVATVLSLDVFHDEETIELFRQTLDEYTPDESIKSLNKLMGGLPLALNQAIAFIKLRRASEPNFSLDNYIDLYKEKSKTLLSFQSAKYTNDPYIQTVLSTWLVTLDKIKSDTVFGLTAEDVLYIMAYLDPENLFARNFYPLKDIHQIQGDFTDYVLYIQEVMHLLKSYSMINAGEEGKYTIHRLVQQVLRIHLESGDPEKFNQIIQITQLLFQYQMFDEEDNHYMHFLLYMSEVESRPLLYCDSVKHLFDKLSQKDIKHWFYFLELAHSKFSKKKYLDFLSDSLAYSRKEGFTTLVSEMLAYFEEQFETEKFSKEDIYNMFERIEFSKDVVYALKRYSTNREKQAQQKAAIKLIYDFKVKIFGSYEDYIACPMQVSRRKRNICSPEEMQDRLKSVKYKEVQKHIGRLGQTTGYLSTGLMTKNFLSALYRGDLDEIALNSELIIGGKILGKISNHLLTQGKSLAADTDLLEKDLDLENKQAVHILFNEEVLSVGKRQFLGKTLQVASPFVARGTSLFFAYNLKNEINAYKMGDKEVLPNIISNGVIVSMDGIEAGIEGAEFLEIITGVAALSNPVLEAISILVWLGTELYEAEEQEQAIQKLVHLSRSEKFVEFMRGLFHIAPSEYLQIKAKNTQLVEHALNFLKNHTDFTGYVVPSFSSENVLYQNSQINLWNKTLLLLDDTNPDEPAEGHLFCSSGETSKDKRGDFTPLCKHALGVKYTSNRTGELTLVNLAEGHDIAIAFPNHPMFFFVQNGEKYYMGGDAGNVFLFEGNSIAGQLIGGATSDVLFLDQFNPEKSSYLLIDKAGFLCGKEETLSFLEPFPCTVVQKRMELINIDHIYGRKKQQDVIYLNQDIQFIDGYGGYDAQQPDVFLITDQSYKNPNLVIRDNTLVLYPKKTSIHALDYRIPASETGQAEIRTHFSESIQHRFFFECGLDDILGMAVQNDTLIVSVLAEYETGKNFTITLFDPTFFSLGHPQIKNVTNFESHSSYFFQDMELKLVNNAQIFAQEIKENNKTIDERIELFSELALRLDKTFSIQLLDNRTLSVGRENNEIFYFDGSSKNYFMGNVGENNYVAVEGIRKFPIEITLYPSSDNYSLDSTEQIDTIDLREIYKSVKKICPHAEFFLNIVADEEDLILTLSSHYIESNQCNEDSYGRVLTVKLKNGIYWYSHIHLILEDSIPKTIQTMDGEEWYLTHSLLFTDNKKVIGLTAQDLTDKTEIEFLRNSGNYSCFRNESDLILTNLHTNPLDAHTMIGHDYYQNPEMKQKLLSSKLKFLDEDYALKDYQMMFDEAHAFSDLVKSLENSKTDSKAISAYPILRKLPKELPILHRFERQIHEDPRISATSQFEPTCWLISLSIGISALMTVSLGGGISRLNPLRRLPLLTIAAGFLPIRTHAQEQEKVENTLLGFRTEFSIEKDCLIAETPMANLMGACKDNQSILYLQKYPDVPKFHFEKYLIHHKTQNEIQLHYVSEGTWETDPNEITVNALPEEIYPLLPPHLQKELEEQETQQQIWILFQQQLLMAITQHLGSGLLLYTRVGNVFKKWNISMDWKKQEYYFFLRRCISTQFFLLRMPIEVFLHSSFVIKMYTGWTGHSDFSRAKLLVRLIVDIVQFGFYNLYTLAHLLELSFPGSESIRNFSLSLYLVNYFYLLTAGDKNYGYLGLALFVLPQLPTVLEHLGIPATRGLQRLSHQLAQLFIGQTLLNTLTDEDEARIEQKNHELAMADARVDTARKRFKNFAHSSVNFFSNNTKGDAFSAMNDETKKVSYSSLALGAYME